MRKLCEKLFHRTLRKNARRTFPNLFKVDGKYTNRIIMNGALVFLSLILNRFTTLVSSIIFSDRLMKLYHISAIIEFLRYWFSAIISLKMSKIFRKPFYQKTFGQSLHHIDTKPYFQWYTRVNIMVWYQFR